jgi:hypothetical protein
MNPWVGATLGVLAIVAVFICGQRSERAHWEKASLKQLQADGQKLESLGKVTEQERIVYVDRIQVVHDAPSGAGCSLDARLPDAVLCSLHYTGPDAPRCSPDR